MSGFWAGLGIGALIGGFVFDAFWRALYNDTVRFYDKLWLAALDEKEGV